MSLSSHDVVTRFSRKSYAHVVNRAQPSRDKPVLFQGCRDQQKRYEHEATSSILSMPKTKVARCAIMLLSHEEQPLAGAV
eukprot:6198103-Pleurochrysis_carterae.AAC.1